MAQQKITAWSFSRWSTYDRCPLLAKLKFLDKLPEPSSPAMERGSKLHKDIELYLKGGTAKLDNTHNIKAFGEEWKSIRAKHKRDHGTVEVEGQWAFRADWTECGWFDSDCWLRIKVDCATMDGDDDAIVIDFFDWKSGKIREQDRVSYDLQLDLYALGCLLKFHDVKSVSVLPSLVYLDVGERRPHSENSIYTLEDLPRLKKEWTARVKPMLNDTTFAPRANNLCRFCTFRKDAGGPCKL